MRSPARSCLIAPLLLLGACGKPAAPAETVAAPEPAAYEWKMITSWPKNLPAVGTSPEEFSRRVARMSNGRLRIRVYGANELVGGLEVFDAVSQGAAEMGHSGAYYWQGKIAAAPFFSSIPFGLTGSTLETVINKAAFDILPPDLQEILLTATEAMNQLLHDELTAKNNEALRILVEEHGVQLRKLPDDVLIELRRISEEVVQELAAADPAAARIYESWREFREGVMNYRHIAEEAFIEARRLPAN